MEPHPVDIHVGKCLRRRRTMLGISQEELGDSVGVTFQQIQKYERGLNRIGCSRLYEFSNILGVTVSYFFEGYHDSFEVNIASKDNLIDHDAFNNKEILTLVRAYYAINDKEVRKKILSLVKALAEYETDDKKLTSNYSGSNSYSPEKVLST